MVDDACCEAAQCRSELSASAAIMQWSCVTVWGQRYLIELGALHIPNKLDLQHFVEGSITQRSGEVVGRVTKEAAPRTNAQLFCSAVSFNVEGDYIHLAKQTACLSSSAAERSSRSVQRRSAALSQASRQSFTAASSTSSRERAFPASAQPDGEKQQDL